MDGAVWLWDLAEDRFQDAVKTLDFHHASEHLWAVGRALYGEGTVETAIWVEKLLHSLRHGGQATSSAAYRNCSIRRQAKRRNSGSGRTRSPLLQIPRKPPQLQGDPSRRSPHRQWSRRILGASSSAASAAQVSSGCAQASLTCSNSPSSSETTTSLPLELKFSGNTMRGAALAMRSANLPPHQPVRAVAQQPAGAGLVSCGSGATAEGRLTGLSTVNQEMRPASERHLQFIATLFTRDFYLKFHRKRRKSARSWSVGLRCLRCLSLAPSGHDHRQLQIPVHLPAECSGLPDDAFAFIFLFAVFWKRINAHGALVCMVVSFVLCPVMMYNNQLKPAAQWFPFLNAPLLTPWLHRAMIVTAFCVVLLVAVSLLTSRPSSAKLSDTTVGCLGSGQPDQPPVPCSRITGCG